MMSVALSRNRTSVIPISGMRKPSVGLGKPTSKFGLVKPTDSPQIRSWKVLGVWLLVFSFTMPIFRSGGKTNLTFWKWIGNHTIWGGPVEFVPVEDYLGELNE